MKATPKIGKVSSINLVDETSELMVISQFGKIIRIDTKSIRAAGRSTQGVKLLDLEAEDKVAAAVVIHRKKPKPNPKRERFCSNRAGSVVDSFIQDAQVKEKQWRPLQWTPNRS